MLFPRRTWARRIVERMGLPARSPEATWLVELVIWAAKENEKMAQSAMGRAIPKPEGVLIAATAIVTNATAIAKLARELGTTGADAQALLLRLHHAGRDLAAERGFAKIAEMADQHRRTHLGGQ